MSTEPLAMSIRVEGQKLFVESRSFRAAFTGASLRSVIHRRGQTQFRRGDNSVFTLELFFVNRDVDIGVAVYQMMTRLGCMPMIW